MKRCVPMLIGLSVGLMAASRPGTNHGEAPAAGNAAARAAAARKVYEATVKRVQSDALFKLDLEHVYLWSRRWMDSEREAAATKAARLAAAEGHLARMRHWEKTVTASKEAGGFFSPADVAAAEFYRLEGETLVALEKGR
jgi:hypothetical protein